MARFPIQFFAHPEPEQEAIALFLHGGAFGNERLSEDATIGLAFAATDEQTAETASWQPRTTEQTAKHLDGKVSQNATPRKAKP